jgi:hypothetical protein
VGAGSSTEFVVNVTPVGFAGAVAAVAFGVGREVGGGGVGGGVTTREGVGVTSAVAVGLGIVIVVEPGEAGEDPVGAGVPGVPPHAAKRTPKRRDAAWRFAFICRRRCGLGRR